MPSDPRLPLIELFAADPLAIRAQFEVDYICCYKQDTPYFHALAKRKLFGHCPI